MWKHNFKQWLIAIDQLLCCTIGLIITILSCIIKSIEPTYYYADESLSSRAYRWEQNNITKYPRVIIDNIFFWEDKHCYNSYTSEREGRQLPPELR